MSDYTNMDYPKCPWCDHAEQDPCSWYEMGISNEDGEESVVFCPRCEKQFRVTTCISWSFSSVGVGCKKHKLKTRYRSLLEDGSTAIRYSCVTCKKEIYNWSLEGGKYQKYTKDQYEILGE